MVSLLQYQNRGRSLISFLPQPPVAPHCLESLLFFTDARFIPLHQLFSGTVLATPQTPSSPGVRCVFFVSPSHARLFFAGYFFVASRLCFCLVFCTFSSRQRVALIWAPNSCYPPSPHGFLTPLLPSPLTSAPPLCRVSRPAVSSPRSFPP